MNSKQRRIFRRLCLRIIEAEARKECIRLGLDPNNWSLYALNWSDKVLRCKRYLMYGYRADTW